MALRNFTNEYLDSRFMERFLRASYDERRGVLRMLHAAHEGLEQGDLAVVTHAALDDSERLIRQVEEEEDSVMVSYIEPEEITNLETALSELEAQAEAEMQPA